MEFDKAVAELDALVQTLEREGDERALFLLELIDGVHRPALELIASGDLDHPLVRGLLEMYDVVAISDPALLAEEALDEIRPYIESHGGEVELLGVDDGVVRVRLRGSCDGCAASALTLTRGIEGALREHFPGFREVIAEEDGSSETTASGSGGGQLLQIEGLGAPALRGPVFVEAGTEAEVASDRLRAVQADGISVLLVAVDGDIYAFRNACPVDGMPLEGGVLSGSVLVCPWHNCPFDARTGQRVDDQAGEGLAVIPVAMSDGTVRVAVNVA